MMLTPDRLKERKVILKMATRKPKTEQVTSKPDAPVCQHQWMTIMGDDPYHHKVICVKCGKEGDSHAE